MVTQPPGAPENDAERATKVAAEGLAAAAALIGGKYRIERVIGEGAFGRVYLATDTRLRRAVAIKELLATRNATEPEMYQRYLARFEREARAGGAITHPNVVTVYEMEIDKNQNTYLVMEYVDGTNLGALLDQVGNLPIERVVAIALDIARGLEVVHLTARQRESRGLRHRAGGHREPTDADRQRPSRHTALYEPGAGERLRLHRRA